MVQFSTQKAQVKRIREQQPQWHEFCERRQLGFASTGGLANKGSKLNRLFRQYKEREPEQSGENTIYTNAVFKVKVKKWLDVARKCHHLDMTDLWQPTTLEVEATILVWETTENRTVPII